MKDRGEYRSVRGEADVVASLCADLDWDGLRAAVHAFQGARTARASLAAERQLLRDIQPLLRSCGGVVTRNRKAEIRRRDEHRCVRCGLPAGHFPHEVDHLFPRALGGCGQTWNLASLCSACNLTKGSALHGWALLLMLEQARASVARRAYA